MIYIVTEIQTNTDNTVTVLTNNFTDRQDAESKYHYVLSFAAKSTLPVHAVSIQTNEGQVVEYKYYKHAQPEPEPEPTEDVIING